MVEHVPDQHAHIVVAKERQTRHVQARALERSGTERAAVGLVGIRGLPRLPAGVDADGVTGLEPDSPGPQDVAMKPPFARGAMRRIVRAVEMHVDDLFGVHRLIGRARRRDQHAVPLAQADIARGALIDAQRIHPQAGVDNRLAFFPVIHGGHISAHSGPRTRVDYCAAV